MIGISSAFRPLSEGGAPLAPRQHAPELSTYEVNMTPESETSAPEPGPTEVDREIQALMATDASERRRLKQALLVAVLFHVLLLVVTFPQLLAEVDDVRQPSKQVFVVQQLRFQPPAPRREEIPKRKTKRIPIPDPTPEEPEPLEIEEVLDLDVDLPEIDPSVFGIPDAPPEAVAFGSGDVLQVGGGVTAPEKIFAPQPKYTEEARQGRVQGVVILQAIIDAAGNVSRIEVMKDLPLGLSESAIETVQHWRFKPATLAGKPVAVYLNLLINFSLQ